MDASRFERRSLKAGLLGSVWVVGLFALAGCGTSSGATRPPALTQDTPGSPAPKQSCSDASSCRDTLQELRKVTLESSCELQKRADVASRACNLEVAEGCTELGRMEMEGARSLFQRACDLGDGEGCARHGLMMLLGEGADRDEAAGMAELQTSCDKYPRTACGLAAVGLEEDARRRSVSPEQELIALFAQRGCDAGDALSCQLLGNAFHEGNGVSRDIAKALELYQRACEAGNGTACANEGVLSLQSGWAQAGTRADDLFSRGCELGSSEACRLLVIETLQRGGRVEDDPTRQALFRQACDRGAAVGCLALYDSLKKKPPEPGKSLELPGLLKRSCRLGEAQACEFLEDVSRVAQRQCGTGSASACGVLGALLLSEPTLGSEASDGMQLLHRACEGGDAASCRLMSEVAPRPEGLTCRQ